MAGEEVFSAVSAQLTGVFDKSGAVKDLAEGFGFLRFLKSIDFGACSGEEEDEEEDETNEEKTIAFEDLIKMLKDKQRNLASAKCLIVIGSTDAESTVPQLLTEQLSTTSELVDARYNVELIAPQVHRIHQDVNYVGKVVRLQEITPQLMLLNQILDTKYLWDTVRVTGGAYGCSASMNICNIFKLVSYRDPHYAKTLRAYENIIKYVDGLQMTQDELEQLKIGAISVRQSPTTPESRIMKAVTFLLMGRDAREQMEKIRGIRGVTLDEVKQAGQVFADVGNAPEVSAIGKDVE